MNSSQVISLYKSVLHFLASGQILNAIVKTRALTNELQVGEYSDRLDDITQNYNLLLQYYSTGIEDPQRQSVNNKLISKLFVLSSELNEELLLRNSTNFEYTQKRYFPHTRRFTSNTDLFRALNYYYNQTKLLLEDAENHDIELNRLRFNFEQLMPELFGLFWFKTIFNAEDKTFFSQIIDNNYPGSIEKSIIISALTLNLWRMFDETKLMMLFDACQSDNEMVKQRAMVGVCFVMAKYDQFLSFFPAIRNRLVLMIDDNHIIENFRNIMIQIISTAETDKISKRMREEILPEVMKISPMLKDKMDPDTLLNADEWNDENPEWQEILEKSGVSDKLKELSELQLEGADVYMSTFSLLKNFPFFNQFSNWFLPFDSNYSAVNELFKSEDNTLMNSFVGNNIMCNSDKYSFCLSILQMPEAQRNMMKNSFKMEAEQLSEITSEEAILNPTQKSKNISKLYIQDLFRFFKLSPQHSDFLDMFGFSLTLHRTFLFDNLSNNADFKKDIAEYYLTKNHFTQALELFEEIQHDTAPSAALYQKIGYMYQQTLHYDKALEAYNKADIIQPDDFWTIRKMALCYRLTGDFTKALEFYQHADFLKPNQSSIIMQIGHCFVELKKFRDALNIYFKLDALEEDNIKVWRAICWCSFVSGNTQQADYYINKLLVNEPIAQDYLNAGHVAWCQRKIPKAIEYYRKSINLQQNNRELFLDAFKDDKVYLIENGIDKYEIPLMLDVLFSETSVKI